MSTGATAAERAQALPGDDLVQPIDVIPDWGGTAATRGHLRLRLAPVRQRTLVEVIGGAFDPDAVAGHAEGLRERVSSSGAAT